MIALEIEDRKDFTTKFLIGSTFDRFLLSKAVIVTGTTVTIDGKLNPEYYDKEELALQDGSSRRYSSWAEMRPLAFERLKGKRLPLSFQFVLLADEALTAQLASRLKTNILPEQIEGLFFNIKYADSRIICTTGVSLTVFSMDKTLEHSWDAYIQQFLKEQQVAFRDYLP